MSEQPVGTQWTGTTTANTPSSVTATVPNPQVEYSKLQQADAKTLKQIQTALKNAGYKVPVNGKMGQTFFKKYWEAYAAAYAYYSPINQSLNDASFMTYLMGEYNDRQAMGGDGSGSYSQTSVSSPTSAKALINKVMNDTLGRSATRDEVKKWTQYLNKQERANPVTQTSDGSYSTVSGGLDREQLLIDQLAGTDEAKRNRASEAYTYLLQVMGGGQ